MRGTIVIAGWVGLLATQPALADFVIRQATPGSPLAHQQDGDGALIQPIVNDTATIDASAHDPSVVHWQMVYGFGNHVPLAFACRQIVPPAVKVTFGPGAGPHMLVTWKGGYTWNHVLRDAVKPLGLHLVMMRMAVEIRE
jgi:hypothetical protein